MATTRPFALMRTRDQWLRAAHQDTWLDPRTDSVQLDWEVPPRADSETAAPPYGAGLAFDQECRLYHSVPDENRVEKLLWAAPGAATGDAAVQPMDFLVGSAPQSGGDFTPVAPPPPALDEPRGLAVDLDDRLYVAESGANRVLVFDLWSQRLLRAVPFASPAAAGPKPYDLAVAGDGTVHVVTRLPAGHWTMTARRGPDAQSLNPLVTAPSRVACWGDAVVILNNAGTAAATVFPLAHLVDAFAVPFATDLEFEAEGTLVVAGRPGADFRRFTVRPGRVAELPPLRARGYDGLGIVRTPEVPARIAYWTAKGVRHAVAARLTFVPRGQVTTYRLDSGQFQTRWGRLFLDACVPDGTEVRAYCVAMDEPPDDEATLTRTPPAKLLTETVRRPDLSPPMPPLSTVPATPLPQLLHRRESGRELPFTQAPADDFATYEAPIVAGPGRYLWVWLELTGNTRLTPRVRCLRAEHPGHDLLRRLPRTYSRDAERADFLRRFLSPFEGFLGDLEARAAEREHLVMPRAAPAEVLPWLASFIGLVFDQRWTEQARRTFLEEAVDLFRYRGTLTSLTRMLEIALGVRPILLEHYRLRGVGGAVLGVDGPDVSTSILGAGFRVGGRVGDVGTDGELGVTALDGSLDDAFRTRAHRFSVIVPLALTQDEREMIDFILERHRPAHTVYDVCSVDAGMRVGLGLLLELTTLIGRTGGFSTLQLGGSALGRGAVLGRPEAGLVLGQSQLGGDSRVG